MHRFVHERAADALALEVSQALDVGIVMQEVDASNERCRAENLFGPELVDMCGRTCVALASQRQQRAQVLAEVLVSRPS